MRILVSPISISAISFLLFSRLYCGWRSCNKELLPAFLPGVASRFRKGGPCQKHQGGRSYTRCDLLSHAAQESIPKTNGLIIIHQVRKWSFGDEKLNPSIHEFQQTFLGTEHKLLIYNLKQVSISIICGYKDEIRTHRKVNSSIFNRDS